MLKIKLPGEKPAWLTFPSMSADVIANIAGGEKPSVEPVVSPAPVETPTSEGETPPAAPESEAAPEAAPAVEDSADFSQEQLAEKLLQDDQDIFDGADEDAHEEPAAPAEPPTPVTPEPTGQEAVVEEATSPITPELVAPAQEPVQPEAVTPPVEPQVPEVPAEPQKTAEELLAENAEWRKNTLAELATKQFAISGEQLEELDVDPGKVISQLSAKVYLDAVEATTQAVLSQLPTVVQQVTQNQARETEMESKFFDKWPQLDRNNQAHVDTIRRTGQVYHQLNPTAPPEQFIQDVGAQTIVALQVPNPAPVAPAAAPTPTPETVPHVPVGTGAPAAPAASAPSNPFEVLAIQAEEIDNEY